MKKVNYLILGIPLLFFTSCSWMFYDNFRKFDDEFKKSKKIIAQTYVYPLERRTEINSAQVIIEREISEMRDIIKVYFVVARSSSSFKIENLGYLKAGNKSFEINIINPESEYLSKNETSVETYSKTDSTGVKTGHKTEINERSWINDKFIFTLTPEMISELKKTDEFIVRLYFGPVPATFRFKGSKLKPISKLLSE
jgi:hypothetical protein